jgi:cell division protein FtsB
MNIDDIIENAQLKGRIIALEGQVQTLEAEVRCLEAVVRAHERVDCLIVANLKATIAEMDRTINASQSEVRRLKQAGTEMGKHLPDTDAANRAYIDFEAGGKS